jgi:mediator of replication checkpoint protein 1
MAVERSSPPPADEDAIDLGDDYLSPRSKVAKMLADIDNAPTPSPTRRNLVVDDRPTVSRPFMDDSEDDAEPAANEKSPTLNETNRHATQSSDEEDDEEEEGIVRRPQGRAARRMLNLGAPEKAAQNESDEDLYSATPLKPTSERRRREAFERAASGSPSGSPSASSHRKGASLFVSPAKSALNNSDGEDDLPGPNRLAELVAQKRAERLARESEQQKAKKSRKSNGNRGSEHASSDLPEEAFEGSQEVPADPNVERILSDAARPTRKASKKAMLEMERETQRLARQQALAHQIKVKKKFSTTDLFARFNFRQPHQQSSQNEKNSSSMPSSDGIEAPPSASRPKELFSTPPSSPPTPLDKQRLLVERGALTKMTSIPEDTLAKLNLLREDTLTSFVADGEEEELPEMEGIIMSSLHQKENAMSAEQVSTQEQDAKVARWSEKAAPQTYRDEGSDDDLEVLEPLPKHLQVFDRIKPSKRQENYSNAIHTLKHLSHLGQVDAKPNRPTNAKPSIHPQVLEAQLRKKAREQAFAAQQERIAELKAKGITIQTTEEKEKEAEEFENLLEKARLDAQDLRKAEKAARREANGEGTMEVSDDETEDEDYYDRSDAEDEEAEDAGKNDLIDDNADESETNEDAEEIAEEEGDDLTDGEPEVEAAEDPTVDAEDNILAPKISRKSRKSHVIEDDDDDDGVEEHDELELDEQASSTVIPASANVADEDEDPFAAFGFGVAKSDANAMSATQAFNATMQAPSQDTQEDSYNILQHVPPPSSFIAPPTFPVMASQDLGDSQTQLAAGPQLGESQGIELNWETQPPETPGRGLVRNESGLSETPGWEPTQDPGLPSPWTGGRRGQLERAPTITSAAENDHETQSTVQLRISESPAPDVVSKRGRLQQRKRLAPDESEDEAEPVIPAKKDAFKEMKRQRLEDLNANDRTEAKAEMKRMMDDQAEESEDEYAGLGGDDTEMIAPETAEDQAMIDSSYIDVDERAIAAHHAARQRVAEEEATKKLYKDITTGGLRRRQREAWDLDEDEDDYIARRRQMRLREETRKRKLLLQDENVKDWAEKGKHTKGKDAFLKAIADDDEMEAEDVIDLDEEDVADESTQQSQSQPEINGVPLQDIGGNKRPAEEDATASQERPPAKQRRTREIDAAFSRPTSIGQVRESLSFLLDEPDQVLVGPSVLEEDSDLEIEDEPTESGADHDEDDVDDVAAEEARQNDGGFAPNPKSMEDKALMPPPPRLPGPLRRTAAKPAVVDRLSLKRGSSSSASADSRSAWSSGGSTASSKAQSLLRRATTSLSSSGANDRGVTTGGGGNDRGVTIGGGARVGGNKKSSLAYQARAEERRTIVEASARRRAENTAKIAELRRANSSSMARIGFAGNGFE